MFRGRHLSLEITFGIFSSSTVILSICLHCCYLLSSLPSLAGPNPQHSEEPAGDAEPCQPPPPEVVTKCRGNVTRSGLSQIICWRLDSWSSFHPFVLLIRHREQTKLPKWSCQKLPTATGAFLGDNKLAQAPFCQPIKFSIMSKPGRGWGWLCGTLAHPWQQQQSEAGKWIHCPIRGTWLAGSCPCGALCGHSRVQTSRAASSPALNHFLTGHCRSRTNRWWKQDGVNPPVYTPLNPFEVLQICAVPVLSALCWAKRDLRANQTQDLLFR